MVLIGLASPRNKSLFASFFSKKEDSSFSEEKEAKRLLILVLLSGTRLAGYQVPRKWSATENTRSILSDDALAAPVGRHQI
jgi:hypothetical protein